MTSGVSSFNAGTVLFTVADLKTLLIKVNLNEVDIAKVKVGQPVRITLDAYPQKNFTGKVRFVAPAAKLQDKIKVFPVEVALDELGDVVPDGNERERRDPRRTSARRPCRSRSRRSSVARGRRSSTASRTTSSRSSSRRPSEGLAGRAKFIWLSDHWKDYFDVVPVQAGVATLERAEILSGLKANDQVCLEDPTKKKVEKDDDN